MNDKKYCSLNTIKYNLYERIKFDINHALDEEFNAFAEILGCKWFVTKKYIEQAYESVGGIFETNLQKSVVEWFNFISDELTRKQIIDEKSLHAEKIADILNSEKNRYIEDMKELMHEVTMEQFFLIPCLPPPSHSMCYYFLQGCWLYLNRQYRINKLKEAWYNEESNWLTVIRRRMDIMFKNIEDICNAGT